MKPILMAHISQSKKQPEYENKHRHESAVTTLCWQRRGKTTLTEKHRWHSRHDAVTLRDYYSDPSLEDARLSSSMSNRLQYLTVMHYIQKVCPAKARILDACAGTGAYCFDLARSGYQITAGDIVAANVQVIGEKEQRLHLLEDVYVGDVCNLTRFADESFDATLCLGAYYHLPDAKDRRKALRECRRVTKSGGTVFVDYLNRNACFCRNFAHHPQRLSEILEEFKTGTRSVFYRSTPEEIERLAKECGFTKLCNAAMDGITCLYEKQLESLSEQDFNKYFMHHLATCEDSSILGMSVHGLFIGIK
jgi:2-polyprenyl-3-methyl-5-hydroxy-6-metoxy-1,4-benzoquinol methylase